MAGKPAKTSQNQQPAAERPKATMGIRRRDDGLLEALEMPRDTVADLRHAGPQKLGDYFAVAFGQRESRVSDDDRRLREFRRTMRDTTCFYCCDTGTIPKTMLTKVGPAVLHFSCACQAGLKYSEVCAGIGSVESLSPIACRLGGERGEFCPLPAKDEPCRRVSCPKY